MKPHGTGQRVQSTELACFVIPPDDTATMNDEVDQRLMRLETTIAHLEHLTERLNEVVTEQARELDHLKKTVQRQAQSLDTFEMDRIRSTNPKPPHYG